jgi:hypothetical protein
MRGLELSRTLLNVVLWLTIIGYMSIGVYRLLIDVSITNEFLFSGLCLLLTQGITQSARGGR